MYGKKDINLVLLKHFDLLLNLDLLSQLETARVHNQIIIELRDDSIDELVSLYTLLKAALGITSTGAHVLHLHHWTNKLLRVGAVLLLLASQEALER